MNEHPHIQETSLEQDGFPWFMEYTACRLWRSNPVFLFLGACTLWLLSFSPPNFASGPSLILIYADMETFTRGNRQQEDFPAALTFPGQIIGFLRSSMS